MRNANDESDRIQERLKEAEEKIKALEQKKKEMSERALMMERPDLYELLESKLTGYQIRGHPYGIAAFRMSNLRSLRNGQLPEEYEASRKHGCLPELKHAVEVHSGMETAPTDCSVCGHALGFLPRIDSGVCEHKSLNCFWNYASTSRRCPVCQVPYPRQMYEFFCTVFVPEGSKVINRDTGLQDVENSIILTQALHAGRGGLVAVNEVDVAARNEDKIHLMTEVSKALRRWRDKSNICGQTFWVGFENWSDDLTREAAEETYNSIMDEFRASVSHRSAHEHLFDQMKSVFDSYVNPWEKSDVQPLIAGLDRPDLDANEFLQQVQHANSDYEVIRMHLALLRKTRVKVSRGHGEGATSLERLQLRKKNDRRQEQNQRRRSSKAKESSASTAKSMDTCATHSFISPEVVRKTGLAVTKTARPITVRFAQGKTASLTEVATGVKVDCGKGLILEEDFTVCDADGLDAILGNTLLDRFEMELKRKPLRLSFKLKGKIHARKLHRVARMKNSAGLNLVRGKDMDFNDGFLCVMRWADVGADGGQESGSTSELDPQSLMGLQRCRDVKGFCRESAGPLAVEDRERKQRNQTNPLINSAKPTKNLNFATLLCALRRESGPEQNTSTKYFQPALQ
ncbi:hypothetical protein R1sor_021496 [Riccia sorocarpa]|uniref:RING-type domain-containing protein n=1 Tax=Riccia sorocarpa TaxID=122646 RepID=A0ABD3GH82_9MARC